MAVACGIAHTLALGERGCRVFACGYGREGQLGAGTREHQHTPAPVAGLEGLPDVVMVAAGHSHSAAMTSAGALLLWMRSTPSANPVSLTTWTRGWRVFL